MPYRLDGVRVYKVKSMNSKGKRKTYKHKAAALSALHTRGKRKH